MKFLSRFLLLFFLLEIGFAKSPPPLRAKHAVVASDQPEASQIGAQIMKDGGNAFDAVVATALALGVSNPHSSGLGGGDFYVIHSKKHGNMVLDAREIAPRLISMELYYENGILNRKLSRNGGLAVAVPGELAGLKALHEKLGRLPWKSVVIPAANLAKKGPLVTHYFAKVLKKHKPDFCKFETLCQTFYPGGKAPEIGKRLPLPGLARTLDLIAQQGAKVFYEGEIAHAIVNTVQSSGGVIDLKDLKNYSPRWLKPIESMYKEYRVLAMPSPSSGGLVLLQMLKVLERFPLKQYGHNSSKYLHLLTEIMKHAYANRAKYMGDDRFVDIPVKKLLSEKTIQKIAESIDMKRTFDRSFYGSHFIKDDHGTTHFSVLDEEGNAAAVTSTINTFFGSGLMVPGYGIVLNNEMDDFSLAPGVPNAYGLIGSKANAIVPGKKPLSSMSPTIVLKDGQVKLALGGSGGPRIISGTLQVLLNFLEFRMELQEAVNSPRVHHQWVPDKLLMEDEIPVDLRSAMILKGHKVESLKARNVIQAVAKGNHFKEAASDPRKEGVPAGY